MDAKAAQLDSMSFGAWLAQQGYRAQSLLWYVDYCCRDDYGAGVDAVSAWAGLHYFCGRGGEAENAEQGAWLTWPEGLQALVSGMERLAQPGRLTGSAVRVTTDNASGGTGRGRGVEVFCFTLERGVPRTFTVRARRVISAMPLHVAARVVENMPDVHRQIHAPWMVANFLMKRFPRELPEVPLSWDNVVHGTKGLGYVVSTHQDIRVAPPEKTVFTSYVALADRDPREARKWMTTASGEEYHLARPCDGGAGTGIPQRCRPEGATRDGWAGAVCAFGLERLLGVRGGFLVGIPRSAAGTARLAAASGSRRQGVGVDRNAVEVPKVDGERLRLWVDVHFAEELKTGEGRKV
jgi:hypothetical protein